MTIEELDEKIRRQEEFSNKHTMFKGSGDGLQLMTNRNCKGKRIRVGPGIYGEIMFWGGKEGGTIFILKLEDAKKLLHILKTEAN